MTESRILEKIRKLKSLSEGNTTEGEMQAAIKKMKQLMIDHAITEEDLAFDVDKSDVSWIAFPKSSKYPWEKWFSWPLQELWECFISSDKTNFYVYGRSDLIAQVEGSYTWIRPQIWDLAMRSYKASNSDAWLNTWTNSFIQGLCGRLASTIRQYRSENVSEETGLVLASMSQRAQEYALSEANVKMRKTKAGVVLDAYRAGAASADRIRLTKEVLQ